jgi:hypothetical protein
LRQAVTLRNVKRYDVRGAGDALRSGSRFPESPNDNRLSQPWSTPQVAGIGRIRPHPFLPDDRSNDALNQVVY